MENESPKIKLLTDDLILQYTEDNVLTEYRDINLKVTTMLEPYSNGVYDKRIFGSLFSDRCNCGNIRTPGVRCPRCGSMILDQVQSFRHYARIESPVYYTTKYKLKKLIKFIRDNFNISKRFITGEFDGYRWSDTRILDICQWNWDAEKETLELTDDFTDYRKCSWEGLLLILMENFPDMVEEYRSYLNQYILVVPMALRAPVIRIEDGSPKLENHIITNIYKNIIYLVREYYPKIFPTMKSEAGKAIVRGCLRCLISTSIQGLSDLTKSSKANLARNMQSNRLINSARCVIVPDPSLKADEVVIPRFVMYETCKDEFIQYLSEHMKISEKEAEVIYRTQSDLPEVQKLFTEYVEGDPNDPDSGKYVLINRQPTLYELGVCTCKVKLTYDYTMKLPQVLCTSFNADFDGDTMAIYSIPKKMNQLMNSALSPRNRFYFKKSHKPLYTPNHESMMGLINGTKISIPDNKLNKFEDIEEALEYKKNNRSFKYQTLCVINNKKTTLGRAILSELFNKDIDAYLEITKDKSLTAKNITSLYEQLNSKEDRLERIQKIQEFALKIATLSGATTVHITDLYLDIDKKYLDEIKKIENNSDMSQKQKEITIRNIYSEFQKEQLKKIPEDVVTAITESSRAKINQLRDMALPQLNVSPNHDFSVGETSLTQGLSPLDLARHAVENRAVQDIKQRQVPSSGYLTRQFTYLASEYYFVDGSDEANKGIIVDASGAEGRTKTDGSIVKSGETGKIKVRSIITSTRKEGEVTADMITNKFKYYAGARVGMSMISSITEVLTQSGLKLKHTGNLYSLEGNNKLVAPEEGTVKIENGWCIFTGKSGRLYKYPECTDMIIEYNPNNTYKAGKTFVNKYHSITPMYTLDSIIKLCSAKSIPADKSFEKNDLITSDCYAIESGEIHYLKESEGKFKVTIDDIEYEWNPDALYFYPDGARVEKYARICMGTLDIRSYADKVHDYVDLYYFFYKQFTELMNGFTDELIEFLYVLLVKNIDGYNEIKSVIQNIHGSDSFFKSLAFADARKTFDKIDYKGIDFVSDPMTSVFLSLVLNNEIK